MDRNKFWFIWFILLGLSGILVLAFGIITVGCGASNSTTQATETSTITLSSATSSTSSTAASTSSTSTSSTTTTTIPISHLTFAEVFTSTGCGWCPYGLRAIERLASEEGTGKIAVLEYYCESLGGGPYTVEGNQAREMYYGDPGYPTVIFDGIIKKIGANPDSVIGSSDYEQLSYNAYKAVLNNRITLQSPVLITAEVRVIGSIASVDATVTNISGGMLWNLKICAVIYENLEASELHFVNRSNLSGLPVTALNPGSISNYSASSPALSGVNMSNIAAIIFVQNYITNEILDSAVVFP